MKINNTLILVFLIISLYVANVYADAGILIAKPSIYPTYIKTAQDIEDWLIKEGFKYKSDVTPEDEWKTPEQTVKDMYGDCEDVAILTHFILRTLGYKNVMIVAICGKNLAHGICWFQESDNTWSFFSTGVKSNGTHRFYYKTGLRSAFDILYLSSPSWEKVHIVTSTGKIIKTYYREDIEKGV
jgi:hypothetical protein